MKPYFEDTDSGITIYHGDCREILPELEFDAVVTDPPYGVDAQERPHGGNGQGPVAWDDSTVPVAVLGMLTDAAPVVWMGAAPRIPADLALFAEPPDRVLIWAPKFRLGKSAANGIAYRFHPIYCWRLAPTHENGPVWDVISVATETGNAWVHPATKPVALMWRLVSLAPAGSVVLDPFMGSGTTLRAAKDRGYRAIGIEIEERYCEVAAKRSAQGVLDFTTTWRSASLWVPDL